MGHSTQFEVEMLARGLELQAQKMLEQASAIRSVGQVDMADQLMMQCEKLLMAIADLRNLQQEHPQALPILAVREA
jgi:hypothetical protein